MKPRHAAALALISLSLLLLSAACGGGAIDERRAKPLQLRSISFLNTNQTGDPLSGRTDSFDVANVLYVGWEVSFENRLYKLEPGQYHVDAAYIGPDGRTLGSVNDFQTVSPSMKTVTFGGRVGNSDGGAFLPGTYTVNFYLNGEYFGSKKFEVLGPGQPTTIEIQPNKIELWGPSQFIPIPSHLIPQIKPLVHSNSDTQRQIKTLPNAAARPAAL